MMRLFLTGFLLFLFSCSSGDKVPGGVMPPVKMQEVLWDIMRVDELNAYYAQQDSSFLRLDKNAPAYQKVFRLHGTTKEQFDSSLRFYQGRPDLLKRIVDSLQKKTDAPVPATKT